MTQVTRQQIDLYNQVGTTHIANAFPSDKVRELTELLDDIIERLRAGTFPNHAQQHPVFRDTEFEDHDGYVRLVNVMHRVPEIQQLVLSTGVAALVAEVIGARSLRVWLDATFSKVGQAPETATPWHNDECTFSFQGEHLPSLWIALTDVDEDNSPLITLAGSHRDTHRYYSTFSPQGLPIPDNFRPWSELLARVNAPDADIRVWTAKAGDVLIIHPKTIHGSLPRRSASDGRRLAFTIRWVGDDVVWRPTPITMLAPFDKHPAMVRGEPPPENLFPVVWP